MRWPLQRRDVCLSFLKTSNKSCLGPVGVLIISNSKVNAIYVPYRFPPTSPPGREHVITDEDVATNLRLCSLK